MDIISVFLPVLVLGVVLVAVLIVVATVASAVSAAAVEEDEEEQNGMIRTEKYRMRSGMQLMGGIPEILLSDIMKKAGPAGPAFRHQLQITACRRLPSALPGV